MSVYVVVIFCFLKQNIFLGANPKAARPLDWLWCPSHQRRHSVLVGDRWCLATRCPCYQLWLLWLLSCCFFWLYHVVSVSCNLFRFETTIWQWGIIRLSWLPKYRCLLLNKRHARAWLPTPRTTFAETWVLVREGRGRKCHPKTRTHHTLAGLA